MLPRPTCMQQGIMCKLERCHELILHFHIYFPNKKKPTELIISLFTWRPLEENKLTAAITRKYILSPLGCTCRSPARSNMGRSKQTGNHKGDKKKNIAKKWKTKRRTKDLDQIHSDMKPETAAKLLRQDVDYDVTGCAQHYCLHCARYFVDMRSMKEHFKTKVHKKRLKQLREEPYTQAEAERAAGMGSYIAPKTVEVKTQPVEENMD